MQAAMTSLTITIGTLHASDCRMGPIEMKKDPIMQRRPEQTASGRSTSTRSADRGPLSMSLVLSWARKLPMTTSSSGWVLEADLRTYLRSTHFSEYPGRRLVMDHAMGREPSAEAWKHMNPGGFVAYRDVGNYCLRSSLLNALKMFCEDGKARECALKEKTEMRSRLNAGNLCRKYLSTRCLSKALSSYLPRLELGHFRDGSGKKRDVGVNFLMRHQIAGVFLVTMRALCGMFHAVAVDKKCQPALIDDVVENHPMRLCPESIAQCIGSDKLFDCLEGVRMLRWRPSASVVKKLNERKRKRREEFEARKVQASK